MKKLKAVLVKVTNAFEVRFFTTCIKMLKMKFLFFVAIAWAVDGLEVNCPSDLPDNEFKVCVSDEITRIWKGS